MDNRYCPEIIEAAKLRAFAKIDETLRKHPLGDEFDFVGAAGNAKSVLSVAAEILPSRGESYLARFKKSPESHAMPLRQQAVNDGIDSFCDYINQRRKSANQPTIMPLR